MCKIASKYQSVEPDRVSAFHADMSPATGGLSTVIDIAISGDTCRSHMMLLVPRYIYLFVPPELKLAKSRCQPAVLSGRLVLLNGKPCNMSDTSVTGA